jgi:microcystin-dependent protein
LPELRGRTPIHTGNSGGANHKLGQKGGEEKHVLNANEMPSHNHVLQANSQGATAFTPVGNVLALVDATFGNAYAGAEGLVDMNAGALANAGGSQGHDNMQPYLAVNFCIALQGLFPSRN